MTESAKWWRVRASLFVSDSDVPRWLLDRTLAYPGLALTTREGYVRIFRDHQAFEEQNGFLSWEMPRELLDEVERPN